MEAMFVDVIQYSLEQVVSTFGCLGDLHRWAPPFDNDFRWRKLTFL